MTRYLSVVPAYGRTYKTIKEVRDAWERGQDFSIQDYRESGYINIDDKPDDVVLNARYGKGLTKVTVIK